MKEQFKNFTIAITAIALYGVVSTAIWFVDFTAPKLLDNQIHPEKTLHVSIFVTENSGLIDILNFLPLLCLIISPVFFAKKQILWGFLFIAFPLILILPLFFGVLYEFYDATYNSPVNYDAAIDEIKNYNPN